MHRLHNVFYKRKISYEKFKVYTIFVRICEVLKGLNHKKSFKKSVKLFWLLNMTMTCQF